jgi:hypothetical protein
VAELGCREDEHWKGEMDFLFRGVVLSFFRQFCGDLAHRELVSRERTFL